LHRSDTSKDGYPAGAAVDRVNPEIRRQLVSSHPTTMPQPSMRPLAGASGSGLTDQDALYRNVLLRLLPLLVIVYIIAYIDRSNVGFAKLGFMKDLGFTDTVFGIGAGVFYAGYMIFEIPSNLMLARIGSRKTLLRIMVLWAVCSGLLAAMTSPNSYYFARFLLGAAEAGLFPGVLLYLTYWVPVSRRTRFTAVFMAAIPLSGVISGPM
jgi:MFS family permease